MAGLSRYFRSSEPGREANAPLDAAIRAWHDNAGTDEELSGAVRERILEVAMAPANEVGAPVSRLFPRVSWRALAWTAPLLMIAVLVVPAGLRQTRSPDMTDAPARIRVAKVNGKVVFTIANGGRPHQVSKSTDPSQFDPRTTTSVTDGSFEDSTTGGPSLVFYRID